SLNRPIASSSSVPGIAPASESAVALTSTITFMSSSARAALPACMRTTNGGERNRHACGKSSTSRPERSEGPAAGSGCRSRSFAALRMTARNSRIQIVACRRCPHHSPTAPRPEPAMQFLTLIYTDPERLAELPAEEFDRLMRGCFEKADALQADGCLHSSQQLLEPDTARTLRVRDGVSRVTDGPFAETREFLAGFNLIEADSMDAAMEIARQFPWPRFGSIEVRPVRDMGAVRARVGAAA